MPEQERTGVSPGSHLVGFLTGATGVGKSAVAEDLALQFDLDLLSVDSRQVYRGLDLGTAKPGPEVRRRHRYHLLDFLDPDTYSSAGVFQEEFHRVVGRLVRANRRGLAVGGTGFYWEACAHGLHPLPPASLKARARLENVLEEEGLEVLFRRLVDLDPGAAQRIDPDNPQRVLRALELVESTGSTLEELYEGARVGGLEPVPPVVILIRNRAQLYARIEARCDEMLASGLLDELRALLRRGLDPGAPGLQTVGYREFLPHLTGAASLEDCRETFLRSSRRYAKRQETWFQNRLPGALRIELTEETSPEEAARRVGAAFGLQPSS